MKLQRSFVVVVWAGLFFASAGLGQQAAPAPVENHASEQEVRALFAAMHLQEMTSQMMRNMAVNLDQIADSMMTGVGAADEVDRRFVKSVVNDEMQRFMGPEYVEHVMAVSVPVYAKYLTSGDVKAIREFYATPAGQNYLRSMPVIQQETMRVIMPQLQDSMAAIMADEQKKIGDYMQKKYGKPKATAPAEKRPVAGKSGW